MISIDVKKKEHIGNFKYQGFVIAGISPDTTVFAIMLTKKLYPSYTDFMKYKLYGLCLAVFIILLGSCEAAESFFEQPPHKTIVITDSDPTYPARISDINSKTILLSLSSSKPDPKSIDVNSLMDSVYTIGRVTRNKINLKLYSGAADYWTGDGYYWILFVLPDGRAEHISVGYISKQPHNFYAENTYLNNIDFMPPINLDLDISGVLPF